MQRERACVYVLFIITIYMRFSSRNKIVTSLSNSFAENGPVHKGYLAQIVYTFTVQNATDYSYL